MGILGGGGTFSVEATNNCTSIILVELAYIMSIVPYDSCSYFIIIDGRNITKNNEYPKYPNIPNNLTTTSDDFSRRIDNVQL